MVALISYVSEKVPVKYYVKMFMFMGGRPEVMVFGASWSRVFGASLYVV